MTRRKGKMMGQSMKTANPRKGSKRNDQSHRYQGHACHQHKCQRHKFQSIQWMRDRSKGAPSRVGGFDVRIFVRQNALTLVVAVTLVVCVLASPTFGVTVEGLKEPVKDLKDTIFGGWMWVPKIGAAVGGCLLAVYNQSIMPLATGAGVGLGIHFYDLYIKADGALI